MGRQSSKRDCCPRRQPRSRIISRLLTRWKIPCLRRRKCLSFTILLHLNLNFWVCQSSGKLILFDPKERKLVTSRWANHSARINSLSWTSDSAYCASGSLDTHVYIWSVAKLMKNIPIKNAGPGGVNGVLWLDGGKAGRLVSTGFDGCVRIWDVTFHK